MVRPSRSPVTVVRIDESGICASSRAEVILDVSFEGRRVWSFWLHRDGEPHDGGHLVTWPRAIRSFLDGTARVTLSVHESDTAVFDGEVRLGSGEGRIDIATVDGRPIALDKSLRRVQTFDTRSAADVEPLMRAIRDVLAALADAGVDAFLAYGTLLGAVRDGKLIGHDSDADLGYLSAHEHPVDVSRESFRLQRALAARGYRVTRYSSGAFKVDVTEPDGTIRGLDVFSGFMLGGRLHLMGEIRTRFRREWVVPLRTATLEGHEFPVPAETDRILAATYGQRWRVPDPAFHFATPQSTHRRFNGWFRGTRRGRARWDRIYAKRPEPAPEPSDLAVFAAEREPGLSRVVDVGCGTGGDVLWFAGRGVAATGLDFVRKGFERAARQAAGSGLPADYLFFNLLELRSVLATSALVAVRPEARVLLARHLVDAISPQARRELWRASRMMLGDGGRLYLQFLVRHGDDRYGRKLKVKPHRPKAVARELRRRGATIVHREVVAVPSGRSGGTPSKICRMVAQWD